MRKCLYSGSDGRRGFNGIGGWTALGAFLMLSAGCLSPGTLQPTRYYALAPDHAPIRSEHPTGLTLGIRPLLAARPYGLPMAVLEADGRLSYREKLEWAEMPDRTVTRAITDLLAASGHFQDVGNAADMARPDLLLTGELRSFHENRGHQPPLAEVEVRVEVRYARHTGTIWAQTLREAEPMADSEPAVFAAAMNRAVTRLATRIAREITSVPCDLPLPQGEESRPSS